MQGITGNNAPSPGLVIPHFVLAGASLAAVIVMIIVYPGMLTQHYFNPKLLAVVHLLVLGWATMVICGVLYQLIPVIFETSLYSEKMGQASLISFAVGSVTLPISFWNFSFSHFMHFSASAVIIAVCILTINIYCTSRSAAREIIEKKFILTALLWLFFTVLAGLLLAINLSHPFISVPNLELLKVHAHAGIGGWFLLLIIGVSSRLIPMFLVSHGIDRKNLNYSFYFINIGLAVALIALYFALVPLVIFGIVCGVAGILFYISFLIQAFKKRVRKNLDVGMKQTAVSIVFFAGAVVALLVITVDNYIFGFLPGSSAHVYGALLLIGFITPLIMGQTYKTLPFIVWLKNYRSRIGRGIIPQPRDLYSDRVATLQLLFYVFGFLALLPGIYFGSSILIRISGVILLCSVTFYNFNIHKIIFHKP